MRAPKARRPGDHDGAAFLDVLADDRDGLAGPLGGEVGDEVDGLARMPDVGVAEDGFLFGGVAPEDGGQAGALGHFAGEFLDDEEDVMAAGAEEAGEPDEGQDVAGAADGDEEEFERSGHGASNPVVAGRGIVPVWVLYPRSRADPRVQRNVACVRLMS